MFSINLKVNISFVRLFLSLLYRRYKRILKRLKIYFYPDYIEYGTKKGCQCGEKKEGISNVMGVGARVI